MKPRTLALWLVGCTLLTRPLQAADLDPIFAEAAKYESGMNPGPLRQIERRVRDAAGQPARRAELEAAVARLLPPPATFEARRFACQLLAIIGTDASLPAIAELLKNDETIGIAGLALGAQRSAKAIETLRNALPAARGQARLQLIGALGNHQDALSVENLASLARNGDAATANTAIVALGKIGTVPAREIIATLRQGANPALAGAIAEATLNVAGQLAAAGDPKAAVTPKPQWRGCCQRLRTPAAARTSCATGSPGRLTWRRGAR
ncbi:MAG: hypothetical protein HY736_24655 [Verrucomicrobia bacterium]|nr:hypothetical protein [Verrucomicrobiota bacterium]